MTSVRHWSHVRQINVTLLILHEALFNRIDNGTHVFLLWIHLSLPASTIRLNWGIAQIKLESPCRFKGFYYTSVVTVFFGWAIEQPVGTISPRPDFYHGGVILATLTCANSSLVLRTEGNMGRTAAVWIVYLFALLPETDNVTIRQSANTIKWHCNLTY